MPNPVGSSTNSVGTDRQELLSQLDSMDKQSEQFQLEVKKEEARHKDAMAAIQAMGQ